MGPNDAFNLMKLRRGGLRLMWMRSNIKKKKMQVGKLGDLVPSHADQT